MFYFLRVMILILGVLKTPIGALWFHPFISGGEKYYFEPTPTIKNIKFILIILNQVIIITIL